VNALLALLAASGVVLLWRHFRVLERARAPRTPLGQLLAAAAVGLAFAGLLALLFSYYSNAYGSSQLSLDVTRSVQITAFGAVLALAVLLHTGAYLVGFFLLTQLAGAVLRHVPGRVRLLAPGVAALAVLAVGIATMQAWVLLAGVLLLFGTLVRAVGLRATPATGGYQASVLVVLLLALASATGSLALFVHFESQLLLDKQRLASNLLVDNDLQGEFLLAQRIQKLGADPFVRRSLGSAFGRPEAVRQRIARQYLGDYFDHHPLRAFGRAPGRAARHAAAGHGPGLPAPERHAHRPAQRVSAALGQLVQFAALRGVGNGRRTGARRHRSGTGHGLDCPDPKKANGLQRAARTAGRPEVFSAGHGHPAQLRWV
jgi:hypothetical protein